MNGRDDRCSHALHLARKFTCSAADFVVVSHVPCRGYARSSRSRAYMMLNVIQLPMRPPINHYLLIFCPSCSRPSASITKPRVRPLEHDEDHYFPLGNWDHAGSSNAACKTRAASSQLDKSLPGPDRCSRSQRDPWRMSQVSQCCEHRRRPPDKRNVLRTDNSQLFGTFAFGAHRAVQEVEWRNVMDDEKH